MITTPVLLLLLFIGTALGLVALGLYMMAKDSNHMIEELNWIPLASFSFVMLLSNLAILSLPILLISEVKKILFFIYFLLIIYFRFEKVLPEHVKDFGLSFSMTLLWTLSFILIKFLPALNDLLNFHGSMFTFASVCVAGALFIFWFVPETKGRSYEEIMALLQ